MLASLRRRNVWTQYMVRSCFSVLEYVASSRSMRQVRIGFARFKSLITLLEARGVKDWWRLKNDVGLEPAPKTLLQTALSGRCKHQGIIRCILQATPPVVLATTLYDLTSYGDTIFSTLVTYAVAPSRVWRARTATFMVLFNHFMRSGHCKADALLEQLLILRGRAQAIDVLITPPLFSFYRRAFTQMQNLFDQKADDDPIAPLVRSDAFICMANSMVRTQEVCVSAKGGKFVASVRSSGNSPLKRVGAFRKDSGRGVRFVLEANQVCLISPRSS